MAPRSNWKGYLKLSLVSCPVALFPAASDRERVSFNMLNAETGNRLKQQYVDAETGEIVDRSERVKGYEISKGDYVIVTDDELEGLEIESSHTIDIQSFSARSGIDPVYFENRYYLAPDDKVGAEAFAVIREAMRERDVVGVARIALYGRERSLMLEARGDGLLATTLRYAYEVRDDKTYFEDIPKVEIGKEMLALALHIIDMKAAPFDPSQFHDRYQDAVVELVKAKRAGRPAPTPPAPAPSNVVDLMEALRRSLGPGRETREAAARPAKDGPGARRPGAALEKTKAAPVRKAKASAARARKAG